MMCAALVSLLLAAGVDASGESIVTLSGRIHFVDTQPAVTSPAVTESAAGVAEDPLVYAQRNSRPMPPSPLEWVARSAAYSIRQKFGYGYYYSLIPYHGPVRYDGRHQFDYPWHASPKSGREACLTIPADSGE
jgi:hypothetical protein